MIAQRAFPDYQHYLHLQGRKARTRSAFLLEHLPKNIERFTRAFRRTACYLAPGPVLCLGARTGAESLGAIEAGFRGSVGIDIHPVGPTVLHGDWHALPFRAGSFANAYSNSLDHCLYLDRFAAEVARVLVAAGRFYLMATNRRLTADVWMAAPQNQGEALYWDTAEELRDVICGYGFDVTHARRDGKWNHYVFRVRR